MTSDERLYDRNFLLAMISQTCFVIANTLMAHYSRWIEFLGGDLQRVGWVMGAGAVFGLIFRPWMAQWINRLGARTMWAAGYTLFMLGSTSNLMLDDAGWQIFLVRSCLVVGIAIVFTSGLTYISQTAPDHRRTEAIGVFGIGGFIGMLIGPWLGDLFLAERARDNFETLFIVAVLFNLLPMVGLYWLKPTTSERTGASLKLSEFVAVARRHWPGMILLVDLAFGICMSGPFVFVASFIDHRELQVDGLSVIGLFFLCYAGLGVTVRLSLRRLPDQIGPRKVLVMGMMFMAVGMACFGLVAAESTWLIIVPALLCGTGHGLMFHTMTSLTIEPFPLEVRGTGSTLALMMLDLGTIAGAPVLGWIGKEYGYAMLFGTIGAVCLLTAVAYTISSLRLSHAWRKVPACD